MSVLLPQITIESTLKDAKTAIRNDLAIAPFCTTTYGKPLTIFIGLDRINPPSTKSAPWVVLTPSISPYDMGQAPANDERRVSFEVYWGLLDSAKTESDDGMTVTQTGLTNADDFGQLILNALSNAFENIPTCNYILYPEEPPLFEGAMAVTVVEWVGLNDEPSLS